MRRQSSVKHLTIDSYSNHKLQEMKELFDLYDKDHNGFLDRDELMSGFRNVFDTYDELDQMIRKYDRNRDQLISFDEFLSLMKPVRVSDPFATVRNN
jgi:Ca2+-binding EF-hand superfamily protein